MLHIPGQEANDRTEQHAACKGSLCSEWDRVFWEATSTFTSVDQ
ncbi:hypothetical protein MHYP_G00087740 [Metynnis hypsauchen]